MPDRQHHYRLKKTGLLTLCFIIAGLCAYARPFKGKQFNGPPIEEFHQREGLPNFFNKVRSGQPATVCYLGGSITAAAGWRDLTFNWLRSTYPAGSFKQINAAIGGTRSTLGVFRMDDEVLKYKPDLLYVEFAVNDYGLPAETIYKAMEGIVRKTWLSNRATDIIFVYTLNESVLPILASGKYQPAAVAMEQIAQHYGIPSIHLGAEVVRLLEADKLIFTGIPEEHPDKIVFTKDKTHPLQASGHPIYANTVIKYLTKMSTDAAVRPHKLPLAYIKDNWEKAQMVPFSKLTSNGKWKLLADTDAIVKSFGGKSQIYQAIVPGASFSLKFKGAVLGAYDVIGPKTGMVDVSIDGQKSTEVRCFDSYCYTNRKHSFLLDSLTNGTHEVTFTVTGRKFDKLPILQTRKEKPDPKLFDEYSWYLYKILLVGDLL